MGQEELTVTPPTLRGRWSELTPVEPGFHGFLYELAVNDHSGYRWRFGGTVPTKAQFEGTLWSGVLSQFVVMGDGGATPRGFVVAYNADLHSGVAYLGAIMDPAAQATGLGVEAVALFTNFLFMTWNLRKIYFEVPEYNMEWIVNSVGSILTEEGRLRGHSYYARRWWDKIILAVYPTDFYRYVAKITNLPINS